MRRAEGRDAVLVRAQAHLAGRRQAQDGSLEFKLPTTRPSRSSSLHGLSALQMASDLSDLSDTSSAHLGREEQAESLSLGETTPPPQPHSRFLKRKPRKAGTDVRQAGLNPATRMGLSAASTGRSSAILSKLAQIEDKIRSRKAGQDGSWVPPVLDDELSLGESFHDSEQRARGGLKYLKKTAGLTEVPKAQTRDGPPRGDASPGSEEEHGLGTPMRSRERLTLGVKVSSPSGLRSSLPGQSSLKKPPHCAPTLRSSSDLPPRDSSPPSVKGTGAASPSMSSTCPRGQSLSERSIVRSLDELFSEAADAPRDASGSSSSDFRVNVFSLDDLVPSAGSQQENLEAEATTARVAGECSKALGAALAPAAATKSPFAAPNVTVGKAMTLEEEEEEEEDLGETEISEQLSSSSARHSPSEDESLGSAEYSEDFEPSPSSAASEEPQRRSFFEESCGRLDASKCSSPSDSVALSAPPEGIRSTGPLRRITMKEAAVQTNCSLLPFHGLQTGVPVTLGQMGGGSSVEIPPIASHVPSLDIAEDLTTYSPAVFALNDLLKQNVALIRQFVEASRRLHAAFVASLEEEDFHYHSLEEAKRYIERHKPRPLTVKQALQQLEEQRQVAS